jgi:hypothetical protein
MRKFLFEVYNQWCKKKDTDKAKAEENDEFAIKVVSTVQVSPK